MADIAWILIQCIFLFAKYPRKNGFCAIFTVYIILLTPVLATSGKRAGIEFRKVEKFGAKKANFDSVPSLTANVRGWLAGAGGDREAEGRVHFIDSSCGHDDERSYARLPKDWVGVLYYTEDINTITDNGTSVNCPHMLDRVKNALMFGASAIIILTLNPKIFKELDVSQLFSQPVVIINSAENVTALLSLLRSKMRLRARVLVNMTRQELLKFPILTMWATCGRQNGHGGIVCLERNDEAGQGKADPSLFWNCFYTVVLWLMLLYLMKSRGRDGDWGPANTELEPERLKALVVVDVAPMVSPGGTLLLSYAERMKQIVPKPHVPVSTARKEAENQLRPVVESPLVRHFLLTNLVEQQGRVKWRLNLDAIIENYFNILDFPEFAHPFTKPTKFIGGSLSHHITEDKIPEIMRLFPSAEITHIPGVGHWVHSENPPEFVTVLTEFLDNL